MQEVEIKETAAYVRSRAAHSKNGAGDNSRLTSSPEYERILDLLATPQTVETLQRSLTRDVGSSPERDQVIAVLKKLLARDMIELSADS